MSRPIQTDIRNRLLTALTPETFGLLQPHLEPVTLQVRDSLNVPNRPTQFVHFLDEGLGSIILGPERTTGVEVAMVGREGFIGTSVVLEAEQSPYNSFIQIAATGWRIPSGALIGAMDGSAELRRLLMRFVHVFLTGIQRRIYQRRLYRRGASSSLDPNVPRPQRQR